MSLPMDRRFCGAQRLLRFELPVIAASDLERLDVWLRVALRIEPGILPPLPADANDAERLRGFSWRYLWFWREMLQAASLPVFAAGQPVRIQAVEGQPQ